MQFESPSSEASEPAGGDRTVPGSAAGWRQIRLVKTFLILLAPCLALSAVSGALYLALEQSTPETFQDIHFWFYFFDVGREINVPTWYSSIMWLTAGLIGWLFRA